MNAMFTINSMAMMVLKVIPHGLLGASCPSHPLCSSSSPLATRLLYPLVHPGHYNTYSPYLTYSIGHSPIPYTPNLRFGPYSRYSSDGTELEGLEEPSLNGWPSSTLALPPQQYADCVFLWYFCTDHVAPGWPSNQGKCQQLLTYCANYIEDKKKGGGADKPFFTEKEVEGEDEATSEEIELVEGRRSDVSVVA